MSIPPKSPSTYILSTLLLACLLAPIKALDETQLPGPGSSDPSIKCGGCPCGRPCYQSPPPPPPPSPPPPPKKPPSTPYCPPPPYTPASPGGGFVYVAGPPGNLYPIDQSYSGASRGFVATMEILFAVAVLELLIL